MDDYYLTLDRIFSSASYVYDRKILSNFINVIIREIEFTNLIEFSKDKSRVLEIGCGTGQEAGRFILSTGKHVTCIDAAAGMIEFSMEKMKSLGISNKFNALKLQAYRIGELNMPFDFVYSLNGALNTEPRLNTFVHSLERLVPSGGIIVISLRNRYCLGELLLYSILGRNSPIKIRMSRTTPVQVVGNTVESFYYSPNEIYRSFSNFKLIRKVGLGIIAPPYLAEKFKFDFMRRIISGLEKLLSRLPLFSSLGDEVLYVFKKK